MPWNDQRSKAGSDASEIAAPDGSCPPWVVLHTAVIAALLIPSFVLTPQAPSLLAITAILGGLAATGVAASRIRSSSTRDAATLVLAAATATAWAALPALLYAPAEGGARLVLLAAMFAVPTAVLSAKPIRRLTPIFVLPAVAGGVGAVLAAGEPSGPVLAFLQIVVGALVLASPRSAIARRAEPVSQQPSRSVQDDLVDLLLEGATSDADDWLWACDERLRLSGDLDRFSAIAGLSVLVGVSLVTLFAEGTLGASAIGDAFSARAPFRDIVVEASGPGAATKWWRLSGRPCFDESGGFAGYRGRGSDLTALREAQARIAYLATHDGLTGLANRETFQAHAELACAAALAGAAPQALLLLDLDGFKQVNDDLGHATGDALLAAVAAAIERVAPDGAAVARLGGDEFAILYAPAHPSGPETLALAIVKTLSAPFTLGVHQARIGVSIGIAWAPEHATLPRDLARKADLALYRAKEAGRGRHVVFVEAFERERAERARLEADIALALERGEFTLHYQPLLDIAEARIGGFEALIRWSSPTRGAVSPAAFIPAAEGTGLIVAIGRFVLARACRDAATWPLPATVAVNISPQHLRSPAFRADVVDALHASGLPPSRLEIEITEGVFLDKGHASLDALTWLRERGIKVALDDFGTGFSSLNYLVDFPVDKIKIDRSFVTGLITSHKSRAVVDAILTLARQLGIRVVAEGVETTEQALALKLRRCDDLQGFLISRPQPADAVARLLVDLPGALRTRVPALLESSLAAALAMKRSA